MMSRRAVSETRKTGRGPRGRSAQTWQAAASVEREPRGVGSMDGYLRLGRLGGKRDSAGDWRVSLSIDRQANVMDAVDFEPDCRRARGGAGGPYPHASGRGRLTRAEATKPDSFSRFPNGLKCDSSFMLDDGGQHEWQHLSR
jgi:hypothetical protein